jgi:hypothetical protein
MRQTVIALSLAAAGAVALVAALPASAEKRTFNLSGFTDVAASAGVTVILKQGPYAITAEEPDGKFDNLKLEVRGDELIVSRKGMNWGGRGPRYTVTVTAPEYRALSASSGSSVEGRSLQLAGLEADVSSGATLELAGTCASLDVEVSSGASFSGGGLRCTSASVDASSGASADVYATARASGDASSGASVRVHGKPADVTKDTSSGGSVRTL